MAKAFCRSNQGLLSRRKTRRQGKGLSFKFSKDQNKLKLSFIIFTKPMVNDMQVNCPLWLRLTCTLGIVSWETDAFSWKVKFTLS